MSKLNVLTKQKRIAENARRMSDISFTALAHHIDEAWLYRAYCQTRKDAAIGVDRVSAQDYEMDLFSNLKDRKRQINCIFTKHKKYCITPFK